MAIPSEIEATISLINERIADLNRAKAALVAAFGGNGVEGAVNAPLPPRTMTPLPPRPPGIDEAVAGKLTRKEELRNFLIANGPSARNQIVVGLGASFPEGTLAYLLSEKQGFRRSPQGLWEVAE